MKKYILLLSLFSCLASAKDTITILSPYNASHSGTPSMIKIVDQANNIQNKYNFVLEFKPGGEQLLAVKYMDEYPADRLAIIAPKYVEHIVSGKLDRNNYVPVHALGDACWGVITNVGDTKHGVASLKGQKEITVGGVGFGNAAHLTGLQIGDKYGFNVRYIPYKSNYDALINMVSDNTINMVLERVESYNQFKERDSSLALVAISCPTRHPKAPNVKTLAEQGIDAPYVFNITIANKNMPISKQQELGKILDQATIKVGAAEIQQLSDMKPPIFSKVPTDVYYNNSIAIVAKLLKKYQDKIRE